MKRKRSKSKIPYSDYEQPQTLTMAETFAYSRSWKMRITHKGRTGIPRVIDQIELHDLVVPDSFFAVDNYIRDNLGSGEFHVFLYDRNDIEMGAYRCLVGGADEYIHPSDSDERIWKDLLEETRNREIMMREETRDMYRQTIELFANAARGSFTKR